MVFYENLLPVGPYVCDVISASPHMTTFGQSQNIKFDIRVVDTDRDLWWWLSEAHKWRLLIKEPNLLIGMKFLFSQVPAAVVGRRFLFEVDILPHPEGYHQARNLVRFPLAEVVS